MSQTFQREAVEVVRMARRISRAPQLKASDVWHKEDASLVTAVDLAVERLLRAELAQRFPDHGLAGEEFPAENPDADYQWLMDPIDGTISFANGIPLWSTILGLHHNGRPLVGVIDLPALDLCYHAARGGGAFRSAGASLDDTRLKLADLGPGATPESELLAVGDRSQFVRVGRADVFDRLMARHPRVRTYPDGFGHTLVAEGSVGAMVDFGLRFWDLAATQVLIEEAGGRYEVVGEHPAIDGPPLYDVVFGKPTMVGWVLGALS